MSPYQALLKLAAQLSVESKCYSDAQSQHAAAAELQFVSLLECFKELLVECLATRSAFISAQRDVLDDTGGDGVLKVPAGAAKDWIRGLFSTPGQLRALNDAMLIRYVKASEFFQDSHLVKLLCGILGGRLFKGHASTRRKRMSQELILEELPTDLAMEVLRKAPGTIHSKLLQLPQSLRPLASIAGCPGLPAACMLPSECSDAHPDLPTITVCVATSQEEQQSADNDITTSESFRSCPSTMSDLPGDDGEGLVTRESSMWLHFDDVSKHNRSLFSLQRQPSTVVCELLARSRALQDITIVLPSSGCLVLGPGSGTVDLHRVTFKGGAVVCMGSDCNVTFHDAVFSRCTLIVSDGAQVTLNRPQFKEMGHSKSLVSIYTHGRGSRVRLKGGTISGGVQGVAVQGGARFEASDLTITGVEVTGVEVNDIGSSLTCTGGKFYEFSTRYDSRHTYGNIIQSRSQIRSPERRGVHVHSCGSIQMSNVLISCMEKGVCLYQSASASLSDCTVTGTEKECVLVAGRSTASLTRSTLSYSKTSKGVSVCDVGSCVHAATCRLLHNQQDGAAAVRGGRLIASLCTSVSNRRVGFSSEDKGSSVELSVCKSQRDAYGCCVTSGGQLTATNVTVSKSKNCGFDVDSADAVLKQCCAIKCSGAGMFVSGIGSSSRLQVDECSLEQNEGCGILAGRNARVYVKGCRSRNNGEEGYKARWGGAHMTVTHGSSDGDKGGCGVSDGGKLTMDRVKVDGVWKSGTLT